MINLRAEFQLFDTVCYEVHSIYGGSNINAFIKRRNNKNNLTGRRDNSYVVNSK